jgi:hypothetical protein
MKRALPSGGASQRRVRRPVAPPIDPNVTHGNAAICRREYANLVAGDRKKKDTDALLIDEANIIAAKMAAFDKFETDEAKLWRSMSVANPDGNDYASHTTKIAQGGCEGNGCRHHVPRQIH